MGLFISSSHKSTVICLVQDINIRMHLKILLAVGIFLACFTSHAESRSYKKLNNAKELENDEFMDNDASDEKFLMRGDASDEKFLMRGDASDELLKEDASDEEVFHALDVLNKAYHLKKDPKPRCRAPIYCHVHGK